MSGDIFLHMCTINENHVMYSSWNMERNRQNFFSFWTIFCPFTILTTRKKIFEKKEKNAWRYHHCTQVCHIWHTHHVWFLRYEAWHNFLSFWVIFCPFTTLITQRPKFLKKWKKPQKISSFYTCVPKIMIRWCKVLEIWCATDRQTDREMEKVIYRGGWIVFAVLKSLTYRSQMSVDQIQKD